MTEEALSAAEWAAFYDMADLFITLADGLVEDERAEQVAAAILYACARFNTFAVQAELDDPSAVDAESVDYLAGEFESHLRDHMEEQVCEIPGRADGAGAGPDRAISILRSLDGQQEANVQEFLDMADQFLDVANELLGKARIGQVSAAFMHGATCFNVYAMQSLGHPPEVIDEALVSRFRGIYADLVRYHGQETLIAPQA